MAKYDSDSLDIGTIIQSFINFLNQTALQQFLVLCLTFFPRWSILIPFVLFFLILF